MARIVHETDLCGRASNLWLEPASYSLGDKNWSLEDEFMLISGLGCTNQSD